MGTRKTVFGTLILAAFAATAVPALAQESRGSAAEAAAHQAQTQQALAEGAVASSRAAAIENLVSTWGSQLRTTGEIEQFRTTLNLRSNRTLAQLQSATSLDGVRAVLLGKAASTLTDGSIAPMNLGDTSNDLTYTPVNPPCRIFDTRNFGGGAPRVSGFQGDYYVYGSGALMAAQGGNPAGCASPKGEPAGIAANFTAVPTGTGHYRVFPYLAALPTVSFLNFTAGVNIANAGIVSTCFLCGQEISVRNFATTHQIGDVMGYFYAVSQSDPSFNEVKDATFTSGSTAGTLASDNIWRFFGPIITHTVVSGDRVHLVANQAVGSGTGATALDVAPCYRLSTFAGSPTTIGGEIFDLRVAGSQRIQASASGVFSGLVGTYQYGLCYRTTSGLWNSNEYGYASTVVLNF
jgi:hypothetical protein